MTADTPAPRSLKHGMSFAASSWIFNVVVALGSSVVISRLYGVEIIGEVALAQAPFFVTTQLSTLGERTGAMRVMARFAPRSDDTSALFLIVLKFSTALTIVVAAIVFVASTAILQGPVGRPELVVPSLAMLLAYCAFDNVSWNFDGVFATYGAGRELFVARSVQVLTFVGLAVGVGLVDPTTWGLILATIIAMAIGLATRCVWAPRFLLLRPSEPARQGARRDLPGIIRFGAVLFPGSAASGFAQQADTWMLGAAQSTAAVGAYSRAFSIASRVDEAGWRVSEILTPHLVKAWHADDTEEFNRSLLRTERYAVGALVLIAAVGGGVAPDAMSVFGEGFNAAAAAFALLLLARTLFVSSALKASALIAIGRPSAPSFVMLGRCAFTVAIMWPLAQRHGASGVAIAWVLGLALEVLAKTIILARLVPAVEQLGIRHVGQLTLGYGAGFLAARFADSQLHGLVGVVAGCLIGVPACILVLALDGYLAPHERSLLRPAALYAAMQRLREPRGDVIP
jgi:O-antigen/teichoic acid export membrane protein